VDGGRNTQTANSDSHSARDVRGYRLCGLRLNARDGAAGDAQCEREVGRLGCDATVRQVKPAFTSIPLHGVNRIALVRDLESTV